jgi:hypothetical protein
MPVIRLYGYGENTSVRLELFEFARQFQQASADGSIPPKLADEVLMVPVFSGAFIMATGQTEPYVEIYADSETEDTDLITLADFVRQNGIIHSQDIDIEIIWHDGTRTYFPKGKEIPDTRPVKPTG